MIRLLKKAFVDFQVRMKRNLKRTSGNSLNPLEVQNKDLGAASQTCLYSGAPNDCSLQNICLEKQNIA